ncbi:MAG: TPR end-of-group domain-containing protein [Candidatus Brocadiales bacterium]
MSKMRNLLKNGFLVLLVFCALTHTPFAREGGATNAVKSSGQHVLQKTQTQSATNQEDIKETLDGTNWFIIIFSIVVASFGIVVAAFGGIVTVLAIIIGVVSYRGYFEIQAWGKDRKKIEEDAKEMANKIKQVEGHAKVVEDIRNDLEREVKETRELLAKLPPPTVTEKPTEKEKEILAEHSKAADRLEKLGGALNPVDYLYRGRDLYSEGKHEEAIKEVDKAIALKPDFAAAWVGKGAVLVGLGKHEESIEYLDKAIELDPQYLPAWCGKGYALTKLKWYDEANKCLDKVTEIAPRDAVAWFIRAICYSIKGEKEKAFSDLKKAIELDASYKEKAKNDEDFKGLWKNKKFKELVE